MSEEKVISRGRLFALFIVVAIIATFVGTFSPMSERERKSISTELNETLSKIQDPPIGLRFIFGNNFMHSLVMFTPIIGIFYGLFVMFSTGYVIQALTLSKSFNPQLSFALLFLFPHTIMEFISYSIAMTESMILTLKIFKGGFRREIPETCKWIAISALILLAAAIFEIALL